MNGRHRHWSQRHQTGRQRHGPLSFRRPRQTARWKWSSWPLLRSAVRGDRWGRLAGTLRDLSGDADLAL